jgi:hypothetical protein
MSNLEDDYRLTTWLLDNFLKVLLISALIGLGALAYHSSQTGSDLLEITMPWMGWSGMVIFIIYCSIIKVPSIHFGEYRVFGERTGRNVREGIHWCWVWQRVYIHDASVKSLGIKESFTTLDEIEAELEGSAQYRVDDQRASKFAGLSEAAIKQGLGDLISSEIGIIAGRHNYTAFIQDREIIQLVINCILCLEIIPHRDFEEIRKEDEASFDQKVAKYNEDHDSQILTDACCIPPESRIAFYKLFYREIKGCLDKELVEKDKNSDVEERYAIDIDHFALSSVKWTEEFQKTMEKRQRTGKETAAILETMSRLKGFEEIPEATRMNLALAINGQSRHQTVAIDGSESATTILRPDLADSGSD